MGTVINTNVQALNSQRSLKVVSEKTGKASEKLSSGLRINRAGDDAAGLAISEKMRNQIKGLNQASRNSQDGISLIQTAEGALQETHDMLQRMRELVIQASNETNEKTDRDKIALELDQLSNEINSTAEKTEFNKKKLIDGSLTGNNQLYLQVGANEFQSIEFGIDAMNAKALGVTIGEIGDVVRNGSFVGAAQPDISASIEGTFSLKSNSDASKAAPIGDTDAPAASKAPGIGGAKDGTIYTSDGGTITFNADGTFTTEGTVKNYAGSSTGAKTLAFTGAGTSVSKLDGAIIKTADNKLVVFTQNNYSVISGSAISTDDLKEKLKGLKSAATAAVATTTGGSRAGGVGTGYSSTNSTVLVPGITIAGVGSSVGTADVKITLDATHQYVFAGGTAVTATALATKINGGVAGSALLYSSDGTIVKINYGTAGTATTKTSAVGAAGFTVIHTASAQSSGNFLGDGAVTYDISKTAGTAKFSFADGFKLYNMKTGSAVSSTSLDTLIGGTVATSLSLIGSDGRLVHLEITGKGSAFIYEDRRDLDSATNIVTNLTENGQITTVANVLGDPDVFEGLDLDKATFTFRDDGRVDIKVGDNTKTVSASDLNGMKIAANQGSSVVIVEFKGNGYVVSNAVTATSLSTTYSFDTNSNTTAQNIFNIGAASSVNINYSDDGNGNVSLTFADGYKVYDAVTGEQVSAEDLAKAMENIASGDTLKYITSDNKYIEINGTGGPTNTGKGNITVADYVSGSKKVETSTLNKTVDVGVLADKYTSLPDSRGQSTGFEILSDGTVKVTGKLKDTDGNDISNIKNLSDLAGKSIKTDKGTITVDADGTAVTLNPNKKVDLSTGDENDSTEVNKIAKDANANALAELKKSGATSPGKVISALVIKLDAAIEIVSGQRAKLGAYQNRMEHTIKNLDTSSENLSASESRIRDTDMAKEMMEFTKSNVLSQAAQSMLAQANQAPNNVLSLLR